MEETKTTTRQITLHFDEDTKCILEEFEQKAKNQMRTTEAQFLWDLKAIYDVNHTLDKKED